MRSRSWLAALLTFVLLQLSASVRADPTAMRGGRTPLGAPLARSDEDTEPEVASLHFQITVATQAHARFAARYSGQNSLLRDAQSATAFVSTVYLDARLWPGAEIVLDPEMSGGGGLGRTLGVAGFPSGLAYRVGDPAPAVYLARLALRQRFALGGGEIAVEPGANQLAGGRSRDSLTISAGRLSVTDVFDGSAYAHDPTTQFFNWALFASGAWDYPADTRGYTWGVLTDLTVNWWSIRAGIALEPKAANMAIMDWDVARSHGLMVEHESRWSLGGQRGAARLLLFANEAHMGSYRQVLANPARYANDITTTRAFGRVKYGFAISADQQLTSTLGAFLRVSADDGATESWAFTEIDRSLGVGVTQRGSLWQRGDDEVGVAVVINALSPLHRRYLAGGGYGFIIGDGALAYAPEVIGDVYYRAQLTSMVALSAIYQPVINPAYNRDRGPVHIVSARVRVAF
jgi:high affinity Mn2+ porin